MKQLKDKKKEHGKGTHSEKVIQNISPTRRRIYSIILLLFPAAFLIILETILRFSDYGNNLQLFIPIPDQASPYYGINPEVSKRYFIWSSFNPTPRKDLFLRDKPANAYRIFVLGESTTAGFPYGNNVTFTRILQRRLSDTFPDRRIEVVNTAMTAINSYAQWDFLDEIMKYRPDALLIYAGHNEFYGALGVGSMESLGKINWAVRAYVKLQRFKTLHSNIYESGKNQFRCNMRSILQKTKEAGIPVLISELICNVRDQRPFISLENDSLPTAQKTFETARILEKEGNYDQARKTYYMAKDLDALRFRAPEEFNEIIHGLAAEFSVPVVPMKSYFESASPNGCIGDNLMYDHLHPNINGYFLMADAFYNTMRQENFISTDWQKRPMKPSSYYRMHWGVTMLDSVYAALTIRHLKGGWPFISEGPNMALYQYTPITKEDSIVLDILKIGHSTLEMGHIKLGDYYDQKGDIEQALKEYEALIYTVPNLDLFYEPALKILLTTKQYNRALILLEDALKYNESGFIYKWIGQIHLAFGDTHEGILALEKAQILLPNDIQLLFNLTRAYYHISQFDKGDVVLTKLKRVAPNITAVAELEAYKKSIKGFNK